MTSGSRVLSYEELRSIAIEFGGFNPNTDGSIGDIVKMIRRQEHRPNSLGYLAEIFARYIDQHSTAPTEVKP